MSVDDFSQKIGRNMYLQGTFMHKSSIESCIEKRKMLQKSHPLHKDGTALPLLFNLSKLFLCFSYETNIRPSNCGKIFKKCMKPREQIQMT